jgi:hypothetical protein
MIAVYPTKHVAVMVVFYAWILKVASFEIWQGY